MVQAVSVNVKMVNSKILRTEHVKPAIVNVSNVLMQIHALLAPLARCFKTQLA